MSWRYRSTSLLYSNVLFVKNASISAPKDNPREKLKATSNPIEPKIIIGRKFLENPDWNLDSYYD